MISLKTIEQTAISRDMRAVAKNRHNPFKNRKTGVDSYLEFVTQYNEFINHRAKPFRKMVDRLMKM
ncbi:MAG: hypothetical protein WC980_02365 [Candidatus Brocadiia bacterium]